jgi:hypothetical protein
LIQAVLHVIRRNLREQREPHIVAVVLRRPQPGLGRAPAIARQSEQIDVPAHARGYLEIARRGTGGDQRGGQMRVLVAGGCRELRPLRRGGGAALGAGLENPGLRQLEVQVLHQRPAHQAIEPLIVEFLPPWRGVWQIGRHRNSFRSRFPGTLQRPVNRCSHTVRRRAALHQDRNGRRGHRGHRGRSG